MKAEAATWITMGSPGVNNRKQQLHTLLKNALIVFLVLNVACSATAATFDKASDKATSLDHQLSRVPVEQRQQDLLAAIESGYPLPPSLEDELEQRLLLSSLLENTNNLAENRFAYNPVSFDAAEGEDNSLMRSEEKRSSPLDAPFFVYRRGCIRRGGNCDHRPNDCCFSSSCRCNLWGSNCRCHRMGLFQKWG